MVLGPSEAFPVLPIAFSRLAAAQELNEGLSKDHVHMDADLLSIGYAVLCRSRSVVSSMETQHSIHSAEKRGSPRKRALSCTRRSCPACPCALHLTDYRGCQ